jgi:hypothetical protein
VSKRDTRHYDGGASRDAGVDEMVLIKKAPPSRGRAKERITRQARIGP